MTIIIQLYIITCIALLVFDLVFLLIKNRKTHTLYPTNTKFEKEIRQQLEDYEKNDAFSEDFLNVLPKRLEKVSNLITLVSVIQDQEEPRRLLSPYVFAMVEAYAKKSQSEQAYFAYAVSLMDYENANSVAPFTGKFMEFLDSNSIYTFSNAMNALYHFGDSNLLLAALKKVDERGEFYHKKLLIDGLLGGNINAEELNPQIIQNFSAYGPYLQASLLDYFRMSNYQVKDFCLKIMKDDESDEEVRFTAMRYFAKFPCPESDAHFLTVLQNSQSQWVAQMLAIQGLFHSDSGEVRSAIRNLITSRDWHVRVNAAKYLYSHDLSHQEVYQILSRRDKYADEILLYCCREDPDLTEFITSTIQKFEEDEKKESVPLGKEAMA